jgi:SSS family solute:Na+ symporter
MLDLFIILSYLAVTLILSVRAGKETVTMAGFSVANRNYSTLMMVAAVCTTLVASENVMYISQKIFEMGLLYIAVVVALPLNCLLVSYAVIPRFSHVAYKKYISAGSLIGDFYDQRARVITGLAATLYCMGSVGAQACAISCFCDYFLGLPHFTGIALGAGMITLYSVFGGIRSVAFTDLVQFAMLIAIIPVTASIGAKVLGWKSLLASLPEGHLRFHLPEGETTLQYISLFFIFLIPALDPALIQRFLMSKDTKQMGHFMKITSLLLAIFLAFISMIGLTVLAMAPETAPANVFLYFINQLLPTGLRGFALAGTLAVIISTGDSFLKTGSIALVHDVLQPLLGNRLRDGTQLKLIRYVTVGIGIGSIFAALTSSGIMEIILIFCNFWMPVVTIPLYLTLWGFRGTPQGFIAASLSGLATAVGWMISESRFGFEGLIPAMAVNLAIFVIVSKLTRSKEAPPFSFNLDTQTNDHHTVTP